MIYLHWTVVILVTPIVFFLMMCSLGDDVARPDQSIFAKFKKGLALLGIIIAVGSVLFGILYSFVQVLKLYK